MDYSVLKLDWRRHMLPCVWFVDVTLVNYIYMFIYVFAHKYSRSEPFEAWCQAWNKAVTRNWLHDFRGFIFCHCCTWAKIDLCMLVGRGRNLGDLLPRWPKGTQVALETSPSQTEHLILEIMCSWDYKIRWAGTVCIWDKCCCILISCRGSIHQGIGHQRLCLNGRSSPHHLWPSSNPDLLECLAEETSVLDQLDFSIMDACMDLVRYKHFVLKVVLTFILHF